MTLKLLNAPKDDATIYWKGAMCTFMDINLTISFTLHGSCKIVSAPQHPEYTF